MSVSVTPKKTCLKVQYNLSCQQGQVGDSKKVYNKNKTHQKKKPKTTTNQHTPFQRNQIWLSVDKCFELKDTESLAKIVKNTALSSKLAGSTLLPQVAALYQLVYSTTYESK